MYSLLNLMIYIYVSVCFISVNHFVGIDKMMVVEKCQFWLMRLRGEGHDFFWYGGCHISENVGKLFQTSLQPFLWNTVGLGTLKWTGFCVEQSC